MDSITPAAYRYGMAIEQGPRPNQADYPSSHADPLTGRLAWAVADGVGSRPAAEKAARVAANSAAQMTATTADPAKGLLEAIRQVRKAFEDVPEDEAGSCVVVAATAHPEDGLRFGWIGDCRAYLLKSAWGHPVLTQLTQDHTEAAFLRKLGIPLADPHRLDHVLTSSIRRPNFMEVGHVEGPLSGRLLLCSDGIYNRLSTQALTDALADPDPDMDEVAARVMAAAQSAPGGLRDNATALVVELED